MGIHCCKKAKRVAQRAAHLALTWGVLPLTTMFSAYYVGTLIDCIDGEAKEVDAGEGVVAALVAGVSAFAFWKAIKSQQSLEKSRAGAVGIGGALDIEHRYYPSLRALGSLTCVPWAVGFIFGVAQHEMVGGMVIPSAEDVCDGKEGPVVALCLCTSSLIIIFSTERARLYARLGGASFADLDESQAEMERAAAAQNP